MKKKISMKYVLELERNVWFRSGVGDPPRTLLYKNAKVFASKLLAQEALALARKYRPFLNAKIHETGNLKKQLEKLEKDLHKITEDSILADVENAEIYLEANGFDMKEVEKSIEDVIEYIGILLEKKVDISKLKKGDKVRYLKKIGVFENGIVKEIAPNGDVFVVYNCGGEWGRFAEFAAVNTRPEDLYYGWIE